MEPKPRPGSWEAPEAPPFRTREVTSCPKPKGLRTTPSILRQRVLLPPQARWRGGVGDKMAASQGAFEGEARDRRGNSPRLKSQILLLGSKKGLKI